MKTSLLSFRLLLIALFTAWAGISQGQVVISQVYGGGGNSGAEYTHDFVELFNRGEEAVNIGGWTIQYASAAGSGWATAFTLLPDFNLQPGQYFLVQQAQGAGGTTPLPTPDVVPASPIAMSGTNLKILLANNNVAATGTNPTDDNIVDFVGFGNANGFEGTPAPVLSNTTAGFRLEGGCQDTNDNGADFITAAPAPRNSASPFNVCGETPIEEIIVSVATENDVVAEITTLGGTLQLVVTVTPEEANQEVVWSVVAGAEYASVDANGLVTALADGTATIRATSAEDETAYDEIDVDITNQTVAVASVTVATQGDVAAEITTDNGTLQLVAAVLPAEANQSVVWSIEAGEELATVSASGLVTAVDNGTVTVRATSVADETIYDEIDVVITNQEEDIIIEVTVETEGSVAAEITTEGGTLQLVAIVTPEEVSQDVTWSVASGESFASVDSDGLVTALANGTVVIRATSDADDTAYGEISIVITNQPVAVASVAVTTQGGVPATISEEEGTLQLVATVLPAEAEQSVEWSVESGDAFVSVSASGLVTAIANGTATVRATSTADESIFGEITVSVEIAEPACDPVTVFLETFNEFDVYPDNCWAASHGAMFFSLTTGGNPAVQMYSFTSGNDAFYMVSPPVSTINGAYVLEFDVVEVNGDGSTIQVGSLSEQDNYADFTPVAAAFTPVTGETYITEPLMPVSGHQYVAIKFVPNGVHKAITIDNVEWKLTVMNVSETEEASVSIFPNPTNGLITITSDERVSDVSVYNALGQRVLSSNVLRQLDLSAFETGIYTVKIQTESGKTTVKRVIKK